jgi:hypothetical protein
MTIDKAIELLNAINAQRGTLSEEDIKAIQLGISALKLVRDARKCEIGIISYPLKGEA